MGFIKRVVEFEEVKVFDSCGNEMTMYSMVGDNHIVSKAWLDNNSTAYQDHYPFPLISPDFINEPLPFVEVPQKMNKE